MFLANFSLLIFNVLSMNYFRFIIYLKISQFENWWYLFSQVNDLPFPYTSVKQFEQSIRTPVGKTWVPETAHKQLVKPKVVTKLGQIIAPIDKSEVFSKQKGRKRKADMNFDGSAGGRGKKSVHKKFNKSKMRKSW